MSTATKKQKKVDVLASALELAQVFKETPELIEKDIFNYGSTLISLFQDETKRNSFLGFGKMKVEALRSAIDDLSAGGSILRESTIGLTFKDNRIQNFVVPFGTSPSGDVLYSISLKNIVAFKNWRDDQTVDIPQDDLNAAIYRLTVAWSQLI